MTIQEAQLFFPLSPEDNPQDIYAERLFEFKQFFLSKPPIRKLFHGKMNKLLQMHTAYQVLTDMEHITVNDVSDLKRRFVFSDVISEAFRTWEQEKSTIKFRVMRANTAQELQQVVWYYLEIAELYRQCWYSTENIDIVVEQLTQEPDPMEVLQQIQDFEAQNGRTFSDIVQLKTNVFLLKEMKRLSLLVAKYGYETRDI